MSGRVRVDGTGIEFDTVRNALNELDLEITENDSKSLLVWTDSSKAYEDEFRTMDTWQIINRIPSTSVICRKVPLSRVITRIQEYFPNEYTMFPKTFILPYEHKAFEAHLKATGETYIVKPDTGSLGKGIQFMNSETVRSVRRLSVAQEYIESYKINETKFDLRVYALIASVNPLRIYVFRDGVARFCSEKDGDSIYSKLTNVNLNKYNTDGDFSSLSKLISEVFPILEADGVDTEKLWKEIENAIALTIIAGYKYILTSEDSYCRKSAYARCFQILGFDILLDKNFKPWVLEANYRPLLDFHKKSERRMKTELVRDAIRLSCPLEELQNTLNARGWDSEGWKEFMDKNTAISRAVLESRASVERTCRFNRVWPSSDPKRQVWKEIIKKVSTMRTEALPGYMIPAKYMRHGEA